MNKRSWIVIVIAIIVGGYKIWNKYQHYVEKNAYKAKIEQSIETVKDMEFKRHE
ncbi:hypothetical protein [Neisseria montereyensis]|uniref:Uncharacterized protein n=1 Tax=Neisseria montereyensis TaxID=2973938 RepID=A0ABT2FBU1_9NEIS|nr:hypothetical protein [Neisseria montereyensis]MCS4532983.1 hypothetical protein [Neisseria montereyensis]